MLEHAFGQGQLGFYGQQQDLADPKEFRGVLASCWQTEWVVYAKRPFGGPEQVLKYLARYTHRVAISKQRLVKVEEDQVYFRWKDYAHGNAQKVMALEAVDFIRRFLSMWCRPESCEFVIRAAGQPEAEREPGALPPFIVCAARSSGPSGSPGGEGSQGQVRGRDPLSGLWTGADGNRRCVEAPAGRHGWRQGEGGGSSGYVVRSSRSLPDAVTGEAPCGSGASVNVEHESSTRPCDGDDPGSGKQGQEAEGQGPHRLIQFP